MMTNIKGKAVFSLLSKTVIMRQLLIFFPFKMIDSSRKPKSFYAFPR